MQLLPFQQRFAADASRFKIALWSRQTGKGFTSAFIATADALSARTNWLIASPSERQSIETLAKCKDWAREFEAVFSESEEDVGDGNAASSTPGIGTIKLKAKVIEFANGSKIYALPGRPESLRGFTGNLILDEFAFFENPKEVWAALYAVITNPLGGLKRILITSTPRGKGNYFHTLVENAIAGKGGWTLHKTTIHEAAADMEAAGKLRGKTAEQFVQETRDGFQMPELWAQEFECEFTDSDNFLLPYDIIALAESANASKFGDPLLFRTPRSDLFCGVDFGRQSDPTVCWTLQREGDVLWTREVLVLKGVSTPDQQTALSVRLRACRRACFDYTGPGIGLGDYLVRDAAIGEHAPERHRFGRLELCTFTAPFKRDIFPKLRRAFEAPVKLRVPSDTDIREDLHAVRQIVHAGQYTYAAPHTAEGHSDRCTALALALRAAGDGTGSSAAAIVPAAPRGAPSPRSWLHSAKIRRNAL